MNLLQWDCGCIGLRGLNNKAIVIRRCDAFYDQPEYVFMERDLLGEPEILDIETSDYYLGKFNNTLNNGYSYEAIRKLLNID